MRALPIVALDEGREGVRPPGLALPCPSVLPLLRDGAVHPLHLAVLPRAVGPRVDVPGAGGGEQLVELAAAVARAVVGHDALDRQAEARVEAQGPPHERRAGALPLVGEQLGVGDAAEVVDRDVQAGRPRPRVPPRAVVAPPERAPAAPVRDPRDLLDVDVDQLPGPLALVPHGGDRPAPADLAGDPVDVGEPGHPAPRHDPGAGAGGHAGGGRQPGRGEQQRRARLADPVLDLARGGPREPARPAAPVGHRLAAARAGEPFARGLAADAHLACGLGDAEAGLYARDERLAPPRGEPCVRMLLHGRAPSLWI